MTTNTMPKAEQILFEPVGTLQTTDVQQALAMLDNKFSNAADRYAPVLVTTPTYQSTSFNVINADATSGTRTILAPISPMSGDLLVIRKVDSSVNPVVFSGPYELGTLTLTGQFQSVELVYTGTLWNRVVVPVASEIPVADTAGNLVATNVEAAIAEIATYFFRSYSQESYTANNGQTIFNLINTYTPNTNSLQVFRNGLRQLLGADYAESSPSQVTLLSPCDAGDTILLNVGFVVNNEAPAGSSFTQDLIQLNPGQTVIPIAPPYVIGFNSLLVHLNGLKLFSSHDYLESDSESITLVTPGVAGDVVCIQRGEVLNQTFEDITANQIQYTPSGYGTVTSVKDALDKKVGQVNTDGSIDIKSYDGTTRARIDQNGNLGLEIIPSDSYGVSFQFGLNGVLEHEAVDTDLRRVCLSSNALSVNPFADRYKYLTTGTSATLYRQTSGSHQWLYAPIGTANNLINFSQGMILSSAGKLSLGTFNTSAAKSLFVDDAENTQYSFNTTFGTVGSTKLQIGGFSNLLGAAGIRVYHDHVNTANFSMAFEGSLGLEKARINAAGDLLVGTTGTQASTKFQVVDSLAVTNTGGAQYLLMGNQDSGGTNSPIVIRAVNSNLAFGKGDNWSSSSGGTFSNHFNINPQGNIGIGSTDDFGKVSILQNAGQQGLEIRSQLSEEAIFKMVAFGLTAATIKARAGALSFGVDGGSGDTERVRISLTGNLLVGTTTDASGTGNIQLASGANVGADIGQGGDTYSSFISGGSGRLVTVVNGAERESVLSNGNRLFTQAEPIARNTTATLTVADLQAGIITANATVTLTLPTGTALEAYSSVFNVNQAFEVAILPTTGTTTIATSAGVTIVGRTTFTSTTAGTLRIRKTATNTFVAYSI